MGARGKNFVEFGVVLDEFSAYAPAHAALAPLVFLIFESLPVSSKVDRCTKKRSGQWNSPVYAGLRFSLTNGSKIKRKFCVPCPPDPPETGQKNVPGKGKIECQYMGQDQYRHQIIRINIMSVRLFGVSGRHQKQDYEHARQCWRKKEKKKNQRMTEAEEKTGFLTE
jgi:hypothetical protein